MQEELLNGKKFIVFGDSIGRGVIYDETQERYEPSEESFLHLLERENHLHIENFTRYGYTVTKGYHMLSKQLPKVEASDFVLLEFGGNDCDFDWKAIAEDPSALHEAKTPLPIFIRTYRTMINAIQDMGKRPIILNLPPIEPHRYFRHVSRGINGDNILSWLGGDATYIYRWHEMYSVTVTDLSQKLGVTVIDIRSPFLKEKYYGDFLCADGIHPNEKGHRLIYEVICDFGRKEAT